MIRKKDGRYDQKTGKYLQFSEKICLQQILFKSFYIKKKYKMWHEAQTEAKTVTCEEFYFPSRYVADRLSLAQ